MRRTNWQPGPWVAVVDAVLESTPRSILMYWHRTGWEWHLRLACGEERYVPVRYQNQVTRKGGRRRPRYEDIIQVEPRRCRCDLSQHKEGNSNATQEKRD